MSKKKNTEDNIVNNATFTNPALGATFHGEFEPKRDRNGKIIYSFTLKVSTMQVDRNFPVVITAKKVAAIASAYAKKNQPLNIVDGVDYRLSGEPSEFEGTDELPPSKVAYYKSIVPEIKRTTFTIKYKSSGSFKITPIYFKVDKKTDRLIEVKSLLECDFIMVEKKEMEDAVPPKGDWKWEELKSLGNLELFCSTIIEKEYPDENWIKWEVKQSYKGNWNIWRNSKLLSSLKNDPRYKKESRNNQQNYNENYNDDYVAIHEEFDRDELDPDLRECWDESFNRYG